MNAAGLYSILIGAAANKCFESGNAVKIDELVTGLGVAGVRADADAQRSGADAREGLRW